MKKFSGNVVERIAAVQRALQLLKKPYGLIDFNCEHYAEYVQTGTAKSDQVDNVVGSLKVIAAAVLIIGLVNFFVNE